MSGCNGITPAAESGIHEAALWLLIEHGITARYIEVGETDGLSILINQGAVSWEA